MFISPKDAKYVFVPGSHANVDADSRVADADIQALLKNTDYQLTKIVEFSGIKRRSEMADTTALGDRYRNNTPTGVGSFEDITARGRAKKTAAGIADANSAQARIGDAAEGPDTIPGFLRVIYAGTVAAPTMHETLKVTVEANDQTHDVGDHVMFEAMWKSAAEVDGDFNRTGF